jgi:hypothetical protein
MNELAQSAQNSAGIQTLLEVGSLRTAHLWTKMMKLIHDRLRKMRGRSYREVRALSHDNVHPFERIGADIL